MNKMQLNKFRMYDAVNLVLDTHSEMVGTEGDLYEASQLLKTGQTVINRNRQVQEADSSGLTERKGELRSELMGMILLFEAGVKAYATATKNPELKKMANYPVSKLKTVADKVLFDIGTLIHGMALPLKNDLGKYFIGEAEFLKMEQLLAEYELAIPRRRFSLNISKVSTDNIDGVFKAQDKLLRTQMDALVQPFQFSHPDFFNAYKNARKIVDYSGKGKVSPVAAVATPV
jgi:hypothetical protein